MHEYLDGPIKIGVVKILYKKVRQRPMHRVYEQSRSPYKSKIIGELLDNDNAEYSPTLLKECHDREQLVERYYDIAKEKVSTFQANRHISKEEACDIALREIRLKRREAPKRPPFCFYTTQAYSLVDPPVVPNDKEPAVTKEILITPSISKNKEIVVKKKTSFQENNKRKSVVRRRTTRLRSNVIPISSQAILQQFHADQKNSKIQQSACLYDHSIGDFLWASDTLFHRIEFCGRANYDSIFEADWHNANVCEIIPDLVELERIKAIMKHEFAFIIMIFKLCSSIDGWASGNPYVMTPGSFSLLFGIESHGDTKRISRANFLRLLIHAAESKYFKGKDKLPIHVFNAGMEYSNAVQHLLEYLQAYQKVTQENYFRNFFLIFQEVHDLFEKHEKQLKTLFTTWCSGTTIEDGLSFQQFVLMIEAKKHLNTKFHSSTACHLYRLSLGLQQVRTMYFPQFLEFLGRVAYFQYAKELDQLWHIENPTSSSTTTILNPVEFSIFTVRTRDVPPPPSRTLFQESLSKVLTSWSAQ